MSLLLEAPLKPILLFNDECAICRRLGAWVQKSLPDQSGATTLIEQPIGDDPKALRALNPALGIWEAYANLHVLMPDGSMKMDGEAVAEVLRNLPNTKGWAGIFSLEIFGFRPFQKILNFAYTILADLRPLLGCESCGTPSFWVRPFARIAKWMQTRSGRPPTAQTSRHSTSIPITGQGRASALEKEFRHPDSLNGVIQVESEADLVAAQRLFEEYAANLEYPLGFEHFQSEIASLPGGYSPPRGALLLFYAHNYAVGCLGLQPLSETVGELKRLYVVPAFRRRGYSRALVAAALEVVQQIGYTALVVETHSSMEAAVRVYESFGFARNESGDQPFLEAPNFRMSLTLAVDPPGIAAESKAGMAVEDVQIV